VQRRPATGIEPVSRACACRRGTVGTRHDEDGLHHREEEYMNAPVKGILIATAVASLFGANVALADHHEGAKEAKVHCYGVNECKGKGACGTAEHDCAGKNACKGKGWISVSAEECKEKGGTVK
jgi:hypothetical protein